MIEIDIKCPVCGNTRLAKNGVTKNGFQRYRCSNKSCSKKTFQLCYMKNGYKDGIEEKIHMLLPRNGIRRTARLLNISISKVVSVKKKQKCLSVS